MQIPSLWHTWLDMYQKQEPELDGYFTKHKFIRIASVNKKSENTFPILQDCDLRNLVFTMYIIKHLRGHTILEAEYNNDTYDLLSLVRAVVNEDVSLTGSFLRVE